MEAIAAAVLVALPLAIVFLLYRIERQLAAIWMLLYNRLPPEAGPDEHDD